MSYHHLTIEERSQIYALKSTGAQQKDIALHLGFSPSSISRELRRNWGKRGYRYKQAHEFYKKRRQKASSSTKRWTSQIESYVESKLRVEHSPEQISGRLRNSGIFISHERIYQYVWKDKRDGGTLFIHLRHRGKKYACKRANKQAGRGCIPNRVDITRRPMSVELKSRLGDWEGDTIIGKMHQGAILSMVDRKSKFTLLSLLKNKTANSVVKATQICVNRAPRKLFKTCTYDNGKEFSYHEEITEMLGMKCYFATPYRSWERGLNEHTNGLVRQYLPKKTDFTALSFDVIQRIEDKLNDRPRKVLGYRTPREVFMGKARAGKIALAA